MIGPFLGVKKVAIRWKLRWVKNACCFLAKKYLWNFSLAFDEKDDENFQRWKKGLS